MMKIVLLIVWVGYCVCDDSSDWGPYPYAPAVSTEYGTPPFKPTSVQVSQENVEFAGQVVEIKEPIHSSSFRLRPSYQFKRRPKTLSAFLPRPDPPKPFRDLNTGEVFPNTQQTAKLRNRPAFFATTQQLPQFQQIKQFDSQPLQGHTVYGPPSTPAPSTNPYPYPPATPPSVHETPLADDDEGADTTDPTVIAVANASGQYYLLGKDNTLQRVVYEASQTEEDSINNGFTAHLRYSPVEPIRDPIYGYDDQGHLVRLYNKK